MSEPSKDFWDVMNAEADAAYRALSPEMQAEVDESNRRIFEQMADERRRIRDGFEHKWSQILERPNLHGLSLLKAEFFEIYDHGYFFGKSDEMGKWLRIINPSLPPLSESCPCKRREEKP